MLPSQSLPAPFSLVAVHIICYNSGMRNKDRFHLTLIILILLLATSTLLFGWVYLASLNNKFQSMIASPVLNKDQRYAVLEEKNRILENALGTLQSQVATLEHELLNGQPSTAPVAQEPSLELDHPEKIELAIDQKCFQDSTNLNECAVLASAALTDVISVVVHPQGDITTDINTITFGFMSGDRLITEFATTTAELFEPDPIAEVVYLNERDITIKLNVGATRTPSVFSFDGQGWIDYGRYSSN